MPGTTPRISFAERRRRLARRHHLAPEAIASNVVAAAADLVGFHGTDPTSAYVAAWARVRDFRTSDLETALYDERTLLKLLGMRRTMFVVPRDVAAVMQSACTAAIARNERPRLARMLRDGGVTDDPEPWIARVEAETLHALDELGDATAAELAARVEGLRRQIPFGTGTNWQGTVGVTTRLLFLLSAEGRIIRGRPKGTLVSSLYRWALLDRWLPGGLPSIPVEAAQAELVRRYLRAFGPATRDDIRWWTGWTVAAVRQALGAIGAVEIEVEASTPGWLLADDLDPPDGTGGGSAGAHDDDWIAFLPALDATPMGWTARAWYLGPHARRIFDANGNAGPTIWLGGRVVGGWAQRRSGEVAWDLLEDVGAEARQQIGTRAAALRDWLGPLRFLPRFRTPLEQELST